jgi:hypothetical protein
MFGFFRGSCTPFVDYHEYQSFIFDGGHYLVVLGILQGSFIKDVDLIENELNFSS